MFSKHRLPSLNVVLIEVSKTSERLQQLHPPAPVDLLSQPLLLGADRGAALVAEHAVDQAHLVAGEQQQDLQFAPFGARKTGVIGGPGRGEGARAAQPVAQVAL